METQPVSKPISKGICAFCKGEIAKNKVTQHLKSCKQRLASIAAQEAKSQETKIRLFHILAEGRYSPEYWLHFEMSATESLWSIDDFLKAMWIDDLDHLSGFTINGTNYSPDDPGDFYFGGVAEEKEETVVEETTEDEETEMSEIVEGAISMFLPGIERFSGSAGTMDTVISAWLSGIRVPRSADELIDYLKGELSKLEKEQGQIRRRYKEMSQDEFSKTSLTVQFQKNIVETILDNIEDRSMGVALARVLKVGQKFSYIYDYGSSTYVNLKVLGEREGIVQNKKQPVQLLARNTAPGFACVVCGKPATVIEAYTADAIENTAYCAECAEKEVEDGTLPLINSPRVGVL